MVREVSIVWKLEVICWAAGDEASCPLYKKISQLPAFVFKASKRQDKMFASLHTVRAEKALKE